MQIESKLKETISIEQIALILEDRYGENNWMHFVNNLWIAALPIVGPDKASLIIKNLAKRVDFDNDMKELNNLSRYFQ